MFSADLNLHVWHGPVPLMFSHGQELLFGKVTIQAS